ncbi:MAG: transposase [Betaproteobacteria bacterium]|nr:transposase [Betaproteobacteria bacterium]
MDGRGVPLSIIVTGANRHDVSQLEAVLESIVVKRSDPPERRSKHLCADAGYNGAPALGIIEKRGYIPHVKGRHGKPKRNAVVRRSEPEVD